MATKEVTYGQLMEMIRENKQPDRIKPKLLNTEYIWDGLNYYRDDGLIEDQYKLSYKSSLTRFSQKCLSGMIFTYEEPVLDEVEKEYLRSVLKPFLNKMDLKVIKFSLEAIEWIKVYGDSMSFMFPSFDKGKMYKGMKPDKFYTPEELGL